MDVKLITTVLQTDNDISAPTRSSPGPRELQPWTPPADAPNGTSVPKGRNSNGNGHPNSKDAQTFGTDSGKWDQFETNKRLFGTTTTYQEEIYTTKLDKNGPDFKRREKEAERLASEIMGVSPGQRYV
jgi:PAB1-binding protein PBP1